MLVWNLSPEVSFEADPQREVHWLQKCFKCDENGYIGCKKREALPQICKGLGKTWKASWHVPKKQKKEILRQLDAIVPVNYDCM